MVCLCVGRQKWLLANSTCLTRLEDFFDAGVAVYFPALGVAAVDARLARDNEADGAEEVVLVRLTTLHFN